MKEEFNLSEKRSYWYIPSFQTKDVKEFIKKRTHKLKLIEMRLVSNDEDDWNAALTMVRDLINDKDKLAGSKLIQNEKEVRR